MARKHHLGLILLIGSVTWTLAQDSCDGEDLDHDGWSTEDGDCNDTDPAIHPGAEELCDDIDNDCDGAIDEVTSLDDSFDDGVLNTCAWSYATGGAGVSGEEIDGVFQITFEPDANGDSFSASLTTTCELTGDYDIQVDYVLIEWPSFSGVRVGLASDDGNMERVGRGEGECTDPCEQYLTHFDDGVQGIVGTTDEAGTLRLVRSGTIVSGYYSDGAGGWTLVHSYDTGSDAPVSPRIASWSHDSTFGDETVVIAFDDFLVNAGTVVCP